MPQASSSGYPALFVQAVTRVLANEGGYARLPNDPGGETRFGVSQRDYPNLDIANLTRDGAIAIYFRDFWMAGRYGELPAGIAVKLFDLSVNMGPAHAALWWSRTARSATRPLRVRGVRTVVRCSRRCAQRPRATTAQWRKCRLASAGAASRVF